MDVISLKTIIQILSPLSLEAREDGRRILELWNDYIPELLPDRYGNWEPLTKKFDISNIELVLDSWEWPFLTAQKKRSVDSNVWMRIGKQRVHSTWILSFESSIDQPRLVEFLKASVRLLRADFACLHVLTKAEEQRGIARQTVFPVDKRTGEYGFFISPNALQTSVPDLFWGTVFGTPYVEMFGPKILCAPAYGTQQLSDRSVLLQMSKNLGDMERHPAEIDDIRRRIKHHLGEGAFFEPSALPNCSFLVPKFVFSDSRINSQV